MKRKRILGICLSAALAVAAGALAQGPPPRGPGGGGHQPGMPGSPGGPGAAPGAPGQRPPDGPRKPGTSTDSGAPGKPGAPGSTAAGPARNALQFGPVGRWWDDKTVVSNVGISRQQQKRMDSIFDANRAAIVGSYKTFLQAQAKLDALNKAAHPEQSQVFAAIDAVNQARSGLQKAASAMLLQIRGEMTPDQVEKLESLK